MVMKGDTGRDRQRGRDSGNYTDKYMGPLCLSQIFPTVWSYGCSVCVLWTLQDGHGAETERKLSPKHFIVNLASFCELEHRCRIKERKTESRI